MKYFTTISDTKICVLWGVYIIGYRRYSSGFTLQEITDKAFKILLVPYFENSKMYSL